MTHDCSRRSASNPLHADVMLLLAVLAWAVSYPIAKFAMDAWPGHKYTFLAGRFWIAAMPFLLLSILRHDRRRLVASLGPGAALAAVMLLASALQFEAFVQGATAGEVAFICSLSSALVPLGLWLVSRQRVSWGTWAGLALALPGVWLMSGATLISFNRSSAYALGAAVCLAWDLILVSYFRSQREPSTGAERFPTVPLLAAQCVLFAIGSTMLGVIFEVRPHGLPPIRSDVIGCMIFMAVIATGVAYYIQTLFQPQTTATRAAIVFLLEPVLAAFFGFLMLSETFSAFNFIGSALILAGVAIAELWITPDRVRSQ